VVWSRPLPSPVDAVVCLAVRSTPDAAGEVFSVLRQGLAMLATSVGLALGVAACGNGVESVTSTGTASGAGTSQGSALANAQGEERSMGSPRCSSTNCEDGTSSREPDRTVTAARPRGPGSMPASVQLRWQRELLVRQRHEPPDPGIPRL
jgi:hypothetical protein